MAPKFLIHTIAAVVAILLLPPERAGARAEDRHENYYYPKITSRETYVARAKTLDKSDRDARISFVIGQIAGQRQQPYPPRYALFAKGTEAEKMIIVGLDADSMSTLFRARAVLAQLTALARNTNLFRELSVDRLFTFFDLAKMLGFKQITVTDGKTYAHQVTLE